MGKMYNGIRSSCAGKSVHLNYLICSHLQVGLRTLRMVVILSPVISTSSSLRIRAAYVQASSADILRILINYHVRVHTVSIIFIRSKLVSLNSIHLTTIRIKVSYLYLAIFRSYNLFSPKTLWILRFPFLVD